MLTTRASTCACVFGHIIINNEHIITDYHTINNCFLFDSEALRQTKQRPSTFLIFIVWNLFFKIFFVLLLFFYVFFCFLFNPIRSSQLDQLTFRFCFYCCPFFLFLLYPSLVVLVFSLLCVFIHVPTRTLVFILVLLLIDSLIIWPTTIISQFPFSRLCYYVSFSFVFWLLVSENRTKQEPPQIPFDFRSFDNNNNKTT